MPKNKNDQIVNDMRILLVDDERDYVDVLYNRLTKRKMKVTKTYSGVEAVRALRKQNFDVAILDLKMEGMDGIEVLKILKQIDPRVAVIMLTGHGSETAAKEGIEFGASDYLIKPCEFSELLKKINKAYQEIDVEQVLDI